MVAGVTVRATRLGNAMQDGGPGDDVRQVFETRSDAVGAYSLRLDAGRYELTAIPARDLPLPRRSDLLSVGVTPLTHDIELHAPAPFGGKVLRHDGDVMSGALVRAYLVLDGTTVLLVGEELSDQNGQFGMVLPRFEQSAE